MRGTSETNVSGRAIFIFTTFVLLCQYCEPKCVGCFSSSSSDADFDWEDDTQDVATMNIQRPERLAFPVISPSFSTRIDTIAAHSFNTQIPSKGYTSFWYFQLIFRSMYKRGVQLANTLIITLDAVRITLRQMTTPENYICVL